MDPRIEKYLDNFGVAYGIDARAPEGTPRYAVWLTDFPGCISQGETEGEALRRLLALAPAYLQTMLDMGEELSGETPAILAGFVQFYDIASGRNRAIDEPERVQKTKAETVPFEEASTQTATEEPVLV